MWWPLSLLSPPSSPFDPPSLPSLLLTSPLHLLSTLLHTTISHLRCAPVPFSPSIRIICISDTHTHTYPLPAGDLLIHAGDLTNAGTVAEIQAQIDWLDGLPHKRKIAIAGNHDTFLDPRSRATLAAEDVKGGLDWKSVVYLQHNTATLTFPKHNNRKVNVYGAPQIPQCGGSEFAFQYERGLDAWTDTVPRNTDVLVTHTPPKYHRDLQAGLGCEWLLKEVWKVKPLLHVCAHCHVGAGREYLYWDQAQIIYETLRAKPARGLLREMFDLRGWWRLLWMVLYDLSGVLWDRVWGGEQERTALVNAALMYNNSGKLGNKVQVVDI
ncbi:Metallo-dependent phosphatase [Aulographum hederae CBS 113979]|uniref:Metallo-dependent phosphatase n=1 Tax=Aulographum hederae CBS 113979 TaxID=1176131 RepID=A0A6G1GNE1_9PEZI|nr:Metallo-dependent phosphatase [Aulographum hederae CBS 113979]